MEWNFVGRERELRRLERAYEEDEFQFYPIKGRRRVGKTTLIKKFMEGKKGTYFSAIDVSPEENLKRLSKMLFGSDDDTSDFMTIMERVSEMSKDEKYILAIDEYPRLCVSGGVSGLIQNFVDDHEHSSKLFLIISGSSMSMMNHEIREESTPNYGRRSNTIDLKPFNYFEARGFLEHYSEEDKMRIYGMVGGMPGYLWRFSKYDDVKKALIELFLEPGAYFRSEPDAIMLQEFTRPVTYGRVIATVADGYSASKDIATKLRMSAPLVDDYLKKLIQVGLIERIVPVDNENGRMTRYRVSDQFLAFFYRYVARVDEEEGDEQLAIDAERILKHQSEHLGHVFETVSMEYLRKTWGGEAGTWWGTDSLTRTTCEIDIILTREDVDDFRYGLFVECKYRNEVTGVDVLDKLVYNSDLVKGYKEKSYAICSKSGFTENLEKKEGVLLLTLEDMVDGWSGKTSRRSGIRFRSTRC
ncbi:MAG: ATP-binding protein [Thermoplasmata archaeon]|nr:ATP-binding protein [Thermoplasmata archaeon]